MRRRIVLSLVLLFALFAAGAIVASSYITGATKQLQQLVGLHEVEGLRRNLVISVQATQADLYTAHTPMARTLDGIVANVESLDSAAEECASCHHRPDVAKALDDTVELVEDYKTALSHYITASANRERIDRIELEAASIGNQILEHTEGMSEVASATLDLITERAISRIKRVRIILLVTIILTTCLCIGVSWYLVRSVTRPIGRLVGATGIIASGDLGHRVEDVKEAEFGELAEHFNAMTAALHESYARLESTNVDLQREISEKMEAEKHSQELQAQLLHAQKMEALGTLSAGIAHEFGNSLQIIQSCLDRLATQAGSGDDGQPELGIIGDATQRGAGLARRLLSFGRKVETRLQPIDMNEQLRDVKSILDRTLPSTIEIQLSLADDGVFVRADRAEIENVLINLALNARDAMPEGGLLRMETSLVDAEDLPTPGDGAGEGGSWVLLRVSDTGHGMDEATLGRIFDPFFTTKGVGDGTGLGLATVYGIVTGYEGRVGCKSEVGRGTVFEIHLPGMSEGSLSVEAETASTRAHRQGVETILVVDDEALIVKVMRINLEEHGYAVRTADSGERAIEVFEEYGDEIDLVILDLGMPGMGGRACLQRLLEIDPDVKVIISSGYGARDDHEEFSNFGARGFLVKPHQLADLLSAIDAVLST